MQKKIPQRQCMGCRERKAKRELIRVSAAPRARSAWTSAARKTAGARTSVPIPSA